jgi:FtsZ-binding cell division protein ZapB
LIKPLCSGGNWDNIHRKLSRCKGETIHWQRSKGGSLQITINSLKEKLNTLQGGDEEMAGSEANLVKQELQILLDQENLRWQQRAKIDWLKLGDRNTKFFHACASQQKKLNQFFKIKDEHGAVWESKANIKKAFVEYFSRLFLAGFTGNLELCLNNLEVRVLSAMNDDLMKPFMEEEVNFALHQMALLKALGPDGLSASFFQSH